MVPICNRAVDDQIIVKTPLMQIGYGKYVPMNRVNEFIMVSTCRLNSSIIFQQVFDKNELLLELYRTQKMNLRMSMRNFSETTMLG